MIVWMGTLLDARVQYKSIMLRTVYVMNNLVFKTHKSVALQEGIHTQPLTSL